MDLIEAVDQVESKTEHSRDDVVDFVMNCRDMDIPDDEIVQSLEDKFLNDGESIFATPEVDFSELEDGDWRNATVKVVSLWDTSDSHESIASKGLIGNETGVTAFTRFVDAEGPEMEEGETYRIESLVGDEWDGSVSANLPNGTEISEADETVEVDDSAEDFRAVVEKISSGGYIERCPVEEDGDTCGKTLSEGQCSDHGDVDGEADLRANVRLSTGDTLYIHREEFEELLDTSMEEVVEVVMDALNHDAYEPEVRSKLLGRTVSGTANEFYRRSRPSASGLDPEGEGRKLG